jgi:type I restriction enzyme S subunit
MGSDAESVLELPPDLQGLPDGWKIQLLGKLVSEGRGISYGVVQPGSHDERGIPIVRVNNIVSGRLTAADVLRVSPEIEERYRRTRLAGGEVLLTVVGAYFGESTVVPAEFAGWNVARAVAVIPVAGNIDPYWICICLRSPLVKHYMQMYATTTAQPTLNLGDVAQLPIPLPPKAEREAIVSVLRALDDKIDLNRRMNETLEALAQIQFRKWFVDVAQDEFPKDWHQVELGDLLRFEKGKKPPTTFETPEPGCSPVILIETFDSGRSAFASPKNMLQAESQDVLMVMDGASSGRVETGFAGLVGSTIATIVPRRTVPGSRFLYYALKQLEPETRQHLTGTSIPHTDKQWIVRQTVNLPSDEAVIKNFENVAASIRSKIELNRAESRTHAALRDALLPKLLSGELRVPIVEMKGKCS